MIRRPPELAFTPSDHANAASPPRWTGRGCDGHRLAGLSGSAVADRFCAWATRSGRRIIVSVFPIGGDTVAADLPLETGVVLAVRRGASGRKVIWAERVTDAAVTAALTAAVSDMAREGGYELHLHLLAADADGQQAVLDDLGYPRLATVSGGGDRRAAA